jgi:hypothetical protein
VTTHFLKRKVVGSLTRSLIYNNLCPETLVAKIKGSNKNSYLNTKYDNMKMSNKLWLKLRVGFKCLYFRTFFVPATFDTAIFLCVPDIYFWQMNIKIFSESTVQYIFFGRNFLKWFAPHKTWIVRKWANKHIFKK